MNTLIDTDVAIHLRDGSLDILSRINRLDSLPFISIVSWIELEGGVYARSDQATERRASVDQLLQQLPFKQLDAPVVRTYGRIVAACGFSRRRILDRLIGATAIAGDLTLITMNAIDFADIPGIKLESWAESAQ